MQGHKTSTTRVHLPEAQMQSLSPRTGRRTKSQDLGQSCLGTCLQGGMNTQVRLLGEADCENMVENEQPCFNTPKGRWKPKTPPYARMKSRSKAHSATHPPRPADTSEQLGEGTALLVKPRNVLWHSLVALVHPTMAKATKKHQECDSPFKWCLAQQGLPKMPGHG